MAKKPLPTADVLRQLLRYDPETGKLFWKERGPEWFNPSATRTAQHICNLWNVRYSGKEALTKIERDGHLQGTVQGAYYKAHRVIWKMVHGYDPDIIDHINGNASDNRLMNLRSVEYRENHLNKSTYRNNSSGQRGVYLRRKRWYAWISRGGNQHHLGTFATKDEAISARRAAEVAHGFHPNHGRKAATQGG